MFKKAQDMDIDIRENMRGGNGKVIIKHIVGKEEIGGKARLLARIILDKDCSIGTHKHTDEEELFYILKGRGRVYDNDKTYIASPGDAILTKGGEEHSIENISEEPLEFMAAILLY